MALLKAISVFLKQGDKNLRVAGRIAPRLTRFAKETTVSPEVKLQIMTSLKSPEKADPRARQ